MLSLTSLDTQIDAGALPAEGSNIVVAMSGGVDSSLSAAILAELGYKVIGVSMQVWDYRNNGGCSTRATCCAPEDFTDARLVAARIGVPYYVFDMEKVFRKEVIDKFVRSYGEALTPNPCIDCNNRVKFRELRKRALSIGFPYVATGHYARVKKSENGTHLLRGVDGDKDQSYFLYGITQEELAQTVFPVGALTKREVREYSDALGLVTADKPESQDICFVSGKVQDFIRHQGGSVREGEIVTASGQVVGSHLGIQNFTVGQRRGLNIGGTSEPLYVIELRPDTNEVVVGEKSELQRESFIVSDLNWVSPNYIGRRDSFECIVQLRHRHAGVPASVTVSDGIATISFLDEWSTVSPGQAAVFYSKDNEEVLGGGTILPGVNSLRVLQ